MKVIRSVPTREEADRIVTWAKTLPGVQAANRYRVASKFHCMISGDFSDEVADKFLDGHRNLAETKRKSKRIKCTT